MVIICPVEVELPTGFDIESIYKNIFLGVLSF